MLDLFPPKLLCFPSLTWHAFDPSVAKLEEVETIAKVTDCLVLYVAKGIALGCFVYARCLYKGYGVEKNEEKAINWFKRVSYATLWLTLILELTPWLTQTLGVNPTLLGKQTTQTTPKRTLLVAEERRVSHFKFFVFLIFFNCLPQQSYKKIDRKNDNTQVPN